MNITPPKQPQPESVCRYGFVFRCKVDGRWCVMLSERLAESWTNATEVTDPDDVYSTLGVDQLSIVQVRRFKDSLTLKDLFTLTLECNGDSTTVAAAIRAGTILEIAENGLQEFLLKQKNPKPLKNLLGQDSFIYDSWLKEKFTASRLTEDDPIPVTDPKEITRLLVKGLLYQYDREQRETEFERYDQEQKKFVALDYNDPDQVKLREEAKARMETGLREFLAPLQEGDEIWQFESGQGSWLAMAGRAGYVILRSGCVVSLYVTRMS